MIAILLTAAVVGLPLGYFLWDKTLTVNAQADTARFHLEQIAAHEATIAHQERTINALAETANLYDRDRKRARAALTHAEVNTWQAEMERDTARTALRGLLEHQARTELVDPSAPINERAGLVAEVRLRAGRLVLPAREVAEVVPLRRGAR